MKIRVGSIWVKFSGTKLSWSGSVPLQQQVIKTAYSMLLGGGSIRREDDVVSIDHALVVCSDLNEELVLGVLELYTKLKGEYRV